MLTRPRAAAFVLTAVALIVSLLIGMEGWPRAEPSALLLDPPDCEAIRSGLIGQPFTAWTSLSFVAVGIWLAGHRSAPPAWPRLVFAASLTAVGLGSFLAHAAQTGWGRQLDSAAIKVMLVAFVAYPAGLRRNWSTPAFLGAWALGSAAVIAAQLVWPAVARPLLLGLALAAVALTAAQATPKTRRPLLTGLILLGLGGIAWWLGRAGGPLCFGDGVFQLHGVWHILAAAGIASVYEIYRIEPA